MRKIVILSFISLCLLPLFYLHNVEAYENDQKRQAAVDYSETWCGDGPNAENGYNVWYNTSTPHDPTTYYNDYWSNGDDPRGDCANFVSQCLIAGGLEDELKTYISSNFGTGVRKEDYFGYLFNSQHIPLGHITKGEQSGDLLSTIVNVCDSEIGIGRIVHFLINYYHAQYWVGIVPEEIKGGDVLFYRGSTYDARPDQQRWRRMDHSMFIAAGTGNNAVVNYHSWDTWHRPVTDFVDPQFYKMNALNFFHLEPTVPMVEKVKIEELNANGSVYRVIYQADRGVGGYPVLIYEIASGSRNLKITLEFNESIQHVRYKDTNNQLGEEVKPPSMRV